MYLLSTFWMLINWALIAYLSRYPTGQPSNYVQNSGCQELGKGRNGRWLLIGTGFPFGVMKCCKINQKWWLHNTVNVLKATELYTSKWQILSYMYFATIKNFKLSESSLLIISTANTMSHPYLPELVLSSPPEYPACTLTPQSLPPLPPPSAQWPKEPVNIWVQAYLFTFRTPHDYHLTHSKSQNPLSAQEALHNLPCHLPALSSPCPYLLPLPALFTPSATLAFSLFLQQAKHDPSSGPLHLLFPLSPDTFMASSPPSSLGYLLRAYLI